MQIVSIMVSTVFSWNNVVFAIKNGNLPIKSGFTFNNNDVNVDIISSTSSLYPIRGFRYAGILF